MVSLQAAVVAMALTAGGPTTMYDFYADWCGPCRTMNPTIDALIAKGYPVEKINIDEHPEMASRYGISAVPSYVMVVNGSETGRVVGPTSLARLEAMCQMAKAPAAPRATGVSPGLKQMGATGVSPGQIGNHGQDARATPAKPKGLVSPDITTSVRLRIEDSLGYSGGSGTIIYAQGGRAIILTCGHIFRDSRGKGPIEVDLFGRQSARKIPGRLISYNLDTDVALVSIDYEGLLTYARVAPADYRVSDGDGAASIGCNHGDDPTVRRTRVLAVDKFLPAPNTPAMDQLNLQIAGQSVEGRSGGGLYSREGLVIGVCNAADTQDNASLYAGLGAIRAELDRAKLSHVYRASAPPTAMMADTQRSGRSQMVPVEPPPLMPRQMPGTIASSEDDATSHQPTGRRAPLPPTQTGESYARRPEGIGPQPVAARFRPGSIR